MKYIKKLSSKLLLALGVIILSVIVWQVIVSKQVIGDQEKIRLVQSIEQIQELLKNRELITYHSIPCQPFSKIKLKGVNARILKGNEYGIYVSDYNKRCIKVVQEENEPLINLLNEKFYLDTPVFIFMPEDPQFVYLTKEENNYEWTSCSINGFKGENTLLSCDGGISFIVTDMPYINANQKDNELNIIVFGLDSTLRMDNVQIKVNAENSKFTLQDRISNHINVDIQLQESKISEMSINPQSKLGTLSLKGTLRNMDNGFYDDYKNKIFINYPGRCDSLLIQLTNNFTDVQQLFLSKDLSGKFEDINCSENIIITRKE